ncbi:MAG: hypothetical protein PHH84_03475 [Oscillospiraceae bacterium]|nr:hypothetical protein [Oscillospiraceae bacterium]MDD4414299.1 hypothetical protein [Oscillospiraceae bacterium]
MNHIRVIGMMDAESEITMIVMIPSLVKESSSSNICRMQSPVISLSLW